MRCGCWVLLGLVWASGGVADLLGAYQSVPAKVVEQNFTGGGPSNLFPRMQGIYNGLIVSQGDFVAEQSGYFRINVSEFSTYSGRMNVGDNTVSLEGVFNDQGQASTFVYRKEWDYCGCYYYYVLVWVVDLELVLGTDQIQGTVHQVRQGWSSDLNGYRGYGPPDYPAREQGKYTIRFPGSADPAVAPPGDGYGAMKIDSHGELSISGQLADGTDYSRSAIISTNGWWPFYLPLNAGEGALMGWMQFSAQPSNDVAGELLLVRPRREDKTYYPNGYVGTVPATGARYVEAPSSATALNWTNGIVTISGGNLTASASNSVTLLPGGGLKDNGGGITGLTFSLKRGNGVIKGKFKHPVTGKKTSYAGVVDPLQEVGGGFFLGTDQGGLIRFEASP